MPQILATKIEGQLARSEILEYHRVDSFEDRGHHFPLDAQDSKVSGIPIQRVDLLVAPLVQFDPEDSYKMNEFMLNLTDASPYTIQEFSRQAVTGNTSSKTLHLGRLTFKEVIGQLTVTHNSHIDTDQPEVFTQADMLLDNQMVTKTDLLRYIVLRPYPDVRAIRVMAELEKELAEGQNPAVNYEFIWLQNQIRAPFITSLKRGRNPFTRSRLVKKES